MKNHENPDSEEKLRAENAFLQMKLMLETGAKFQEGKEGLSRVPPEIENRFLKNVIAFNEFNQNPKLTTVYKKIGSPLQFKPVKEIPDSEIGRAWNELSEYMHRYGIGLEVCSPNVTVREVYRFTVEELFQQEMDDIDLPGWNNNFIYDEFHPDYFYDNTRLVIENILPEIFSEQEIEHTAHYAKIGIQLNEHQDMSEEDLKVVLNRFKASFEKINLKETTHVICKIDENKCSVSGKYMATGFSGNVKMKWNGSFVAELIFISEYGYWYAYNIQIEGLVL